SQPGLPTLQIVAIEDGTFIELLPKVDILGGGGIAMTASRTVASYTLQRGEVLQLTQDKELTGSVLESSKPVGVFGGSTCMHVPADVVACDNDNSQIPPLSAWGNEYAVLPAPNRANLVSHGEQSERDPSVVRVVGASDGTELVYEPYRPEGAPDRLQSGELAAFFANGPFVMRSQDVAHSFLATTLMTGCNAAGSGMGDPETSLAVPTRQWLDDYVFFSDHTYPLSAAFVTRRKLNGTFHDVTLDCAGTLTNWKPITADYEWTYVEFTRFFEAQPYGDGKCTDGAHHIRSDGPFTLNVWGLGFAASYEYAGGTGLRPATELHVPVR
ncbi:MAG: hypothetical protein K0S65_6316, partial [Labilithrix sp.]|nr:hypothetical protein [Labilithrix sp.]